MLHHGGVDAILPVVLPVLAGLILRRAGAVLAAIGLAGWAVWVGLETSSPRDLGRAVAFGLVGGALLGSAGALLRSRVLRRRRPDAGSTW